MPIDQLIGFAGSAKGEEYFGADAAKGNSGACQRDKGCRRKILRLSRMLCSRRYSQKKKKICSGNTIAGMQKKDILNRSNSECPFYCLFQEPSGQDDCDSRQNTDGRQRSV